MTQVKVITRPSGPTSPDVGIKGAALKALDAGLSVIPIKADGSKAPPISWKRYQAAPPSPQEIEEWFGDSAPVSVALVCGNELEALDFDCAMAFEEFVRGANDVGLGDLLVRLRAGYEERTPRGGTHLFYRCSTVDGSQKLGSPPRPSATASSSSVARSVSSFSLTGTISGNKPSTSFSSTSVPTARTTSSPRNTLSNG